MEKAPPQSSMIRQGQGSLAYSSILTLQRSFAICSCENCANFNWFAKNQVMGTSNTGLTSMAMAMNTTACDYIDDASVYAFLITPIFKKRKLAWHGNVHKYDRLSVRTSVLAQCISV